jgi:hypothetical protein
MKSRATLAVAVLSLVILFLGTGMLEGTGRGRTTTIIGGAKVEKGSGQVVTELRDIGSFDRIESNIGADIAVTIGASQKVSLSYDDNLIGYITTKVKGGKLIIESDRSISSQENCQFKIVVPQLDGIAVGGSGRIEVNGLDGNRFSVEIDGSGDVMASGEVGELAIEVNGSGNVDTRDLTAGEATVEINGSGDVDVMARDYLTAVINGSGDIRYAGNPGQIVKRVDGSGHIRRR